MVSRAARVWLPALTLLGVLVVAVTRAARPLTNPDTYFHLRFGAEFLAGWSLRDPGSVSSSATRDWLPTQWLPQVLMAAIEDRTGLPGVAWLSEPREGPGGPPFYSPASTRTARSPAGRCVIEDGR